MEFLPGKDYYFISTSSPRDLHQRVDGMCRDNNMKLVFKVADPNAPKPTTTTTTTTPPPPSTKYVNYDSFKNDNVFENESLDADLVVLNEISKEEEIDTEKVTGSRKRKHGNKRKRKKHHRNKNRRNFSSESNRGILNDNPPLISDSDRLGGGPNQVIEKKLSPVERVNNLMKQEASIRASSGGGSSSKSWNFLFSTLALFLLSSFV